jgi:zinc finger protein
MNRQVILGDHAGYHIPELEFEAPQNAERRGVLTTLEGLLEKTIAGLSQDQAARRVRACVWTRALFAAFQLVISQR